MIIIFLIDRIEIPKRTFSTDYPRLSQDDLTDLAEIFLNVWNCLRIRPISFSDIWKREAKLWVKRSKFWVF